MSKAQKYLNRHLSRVKRNLSTYSADYFVLSQPKKNSFFSWYSRQLDEQPIFTKCASACLIASSGNIFAQGIQHYKAEEKDKNKNGFVIDLGQVGRFAFLNAVFVAPVLHHWYQFINRAVPGKSMSKVLQRVFWDEFVFSPVYIPVFLGGLWSLEGATPQKIKSMIYKEVPPIIVAEWIMWVPTMAVTFRYVPVKFQVLVINCVGVVWQTFLSFMANKAHGNIEEEKDENMRTNELAIDFRTKEVGGVTTIEPHLDHIFQQIISAW
jgi:hypothetical protein